MITQRIYTGNEAMILKVSVATQSKQDIRLIVRDSEQEYTNLTDRIAEVNGNFDFYVRMPLCRKYVDVEISNENDPSNDSSFTYTGELGSGYETMHLKKRLSVIDFTRYNLNDYIKFIQKFCYNAGVLRTNDINDPDDLYCSDKSFFFIRYLPIIRDYKTGEEVVTPCRIDVETGLIEVSQKYFINYSVPGRIATLLHEFSHPFINKDPDDETEADLNGLIIYLGLGYPRIEAIYVWCQVFEQTDTEENMERLSYIKKFIEDFDSGKMVF